MWGRELEIFSNVCHFRLLLQTCKIISQKMSKFRTIKANIIPSSPHCFKGWLNIFSDIFFHYRYSYYIETIRMKKEKTSLTIEKMFLFFVEKTKLFFLNLISSLLTRIWRYSNAHCCIQASFGVVWTVWAPNNLPSKCFASLFPYIYYVKSKWSSLRTLRNKNFLA